VTARSVETPVRSQPRARRRLALDGLVLLAALAAASVGLWASGCGAPVAAVSTTVYRPTSAVAAVVGAVPAGHCELRTALEPLAIRQAPVGAALLVPPLTSASRPALIRAALLSPGDVPASLSIPPLQPPPELLVA
jgi:hypothetical protein